MLRDNSPIVATLVDDLIADAECYIEAGVEDGVVRPSNDPRTRAVVLTMWHLGTLALRDHVERLLGVDLADPEAEPEAMAAYVGSVLELFTHGVLADTVTRPSPSRDPS